MTFTSEWQQYASHLRAQGVVGKPGSEQIGKDMTWDDIEAMDDGQQEQLLRLHESATEVAKELPNAILDVAEVYGEPARPRGEA